MFGIYRLFLALVVAASHARADLVPSAGLYAVFAFYVLSGYLMTLVLHQTYGFDAHGLRHFLANRALRIYPPYLVALVLTIAVFCAPSLWHGQIPAKLSQSSWLNLLSETLLVDLTGGAIRARWIPPSWSLDVEVGFYVAMALVLARSKVTIVTWTCLSVAYLVYLLVSDIGFGARYVGFAAASLPFSGGSAIYLFRQSLPASTRRRAVLCGGALAANTLVGVHLWSNALGAPFYLSLLLALCTTAALRDPAALGVSPRTRRIDAWLGDLAYPVFLCHYAVGLIANRLLPTVARRQDVLFVVTIVGSLAVAWLMHRTIEGPVARVRDRVRPRRRVDA